MTDLVSEGKPIHLDLLVQHKDPALPRFVVVPSAEIAHLQLAGTTVVTGRVNGVSFGRQTISDTVRIAFQVAPDEMPAELEATLRDPSAAANWARLTPNQQRMLQEEILALKSPAARERRASQRLLGK